MLSIITFLTLKNIFEFKMAGEQSKRKQWTPEETQGFLRCYMGRKDEFVHARKKKFAYQHVLEDMVAQKITDPSTTVSSLESRMRTLLGAYKAAVDNTRQTGAAPCYTPYKEQMDEIFGRSPIISNVHTLQMGHGPVEPLQAVPLVNESNFETVQEMPSSSKIVLKRKNYRQEYYNAKLEIKRKNSEEKREQRERFLNKMSECFQKSMQEKNEIEKRKLEILQNFLVNN